MSERRKLLIVDDDRDLLDLMAIRLGAAGYETVLAESAAEALTRLDIERPDAVITDLRMQGMDGLALFDRIHTDRPALPVIILTAHGSIPEAVSATQRGVVAFLAKPFDGQELVAQVQRAIGVSGEYRDEVDPFAPQVPGGPEIITRNPEMQELLSQARRVAASEASVLISGQSGTGKELLAQMIHHWSSRREMEFVPLNCAAIPGELLESELFGHARGAFTGAIRDYPGLFRSAHRGTLFFDEIGDMPQMLQAKLLRVLQEKRVRPIGSTDTLEVDVRVVSATHRDLTEEVAEGRFREDLFYRLNVVVLEVPSLDRRREDIPLLAQRFLQRLCASGVKNVKGFAPDAMELLMRAPWPGNIRQLHNVIEHAYALTGSALLSQTLIRQGLRERVPEPSSLDEAASRFEREYLVRLLKFSQGNVALAARTARRNRTDFYRLLHRHELDPGVFKITS